MEQTPFIGVPAPLAEPRAGPRVHLLMLLTIIYMAAVTYWLWQIDWSFDFKFHLLFVMPALVGLYVAWIKIELSIRDDVARCVAGKPTRNGIPHHGVFFVKACAPAPQPGRHVLALSSSASAMDFKTAFSSSALTAFSPTRWSSWR